MTKYLGFQCRSLWMTVKHRRPRDFCFICYLASEFQADQAVISLITRDQNSQHTNYTNSLHTQAKTQFAYRCNIRRGGCRWVAIGQCWSSGLGLVRNSDELPAGFPSTRKRSLWMSPCHVAAAVTGRRQCVSDRCWTQPQSHSTPPAGRLPGTTVLHLDPPMCRPARPARRVGRDGRQRGPRREWCDDRARRRRSTGSRPLHAGRARQRRWWDATFVGRERYSREMRPGSSSSLDDSRQQTILAMTTHHANLSLLGARQKFVCSWRILLN